NSDPFGATPDGTVGTSHGSSPCRSSSGPSSSNRHPHDSSCPPQRGHPCTSQPGWCKPPHSTPQSPQRCLRQPSLAGSLPCRLSSTRRPSTWNASTVHDWPVVISDPQNPQIAIDSS